MVHSATIPVTTRKRCCWVDITDQVQNVVGESGITSGICNVNGLHTTAGLTLNENADPDVGIDFFNGLSTLVPRDENYRHSEGNSDSHIKASLVGFHVQVPVLNSRLVLGTWQSIYFCEFDGPRSRRFHIQLVRDSKS